MLRERFGVSERFACEVVGQHRSTQRYDKAPPDDAEEVLRGWLRRFATDNPRRGWRGAYKELRRDGHVHYRKKIQALWRDEGLKVPYRGRKKHRSAHRSVGPFCPLWINILWACDFQFDHTSNGRQFKIFNLIDERSRESLAGDVGRHFTSVDVIATLDRVAAERGYPRYIRCDIHTECCAGWVTLSGLLVA